MQNPNQMMSQMKSRVKMTEEVIEKDYNAYMHSWYSTADFLLYIFIAILFFSLGKNFATI